MSLAEFGATPRREYRAPAIEPAPIDETSVVIECPCGRRLAHEADTLPDNAELTTLHIPSARLVAAAFDGVENDVLMRGWDCSSTECTRVVVETFEVAERLGRTDNLKTGWYPLRVHLDAPDHTAVAFAPSRFVDDLLAQTNPDVAFDGGAP